MHNDAVPLFLLLSDAKSGVLNTMKRLILIPILLAASLLPCAAATIGGNRTPDGQEIQIDLPPELHQKNIASRGLGCCVFRSLDHAARWQDIAALQHFPEWMVQRGIAGGGYPQKVSDLIPKISKDRGLPPPDYIQVEDNDLEILKLACKTGRMPGVTYSFSPSGRYGGGRIAHMVNLVHADDKHFCVLDNNFVGANQYEWLSPQEFLKTYSGGRTGWCVILMPPPPPPIPVN
jgi:hypothetical protein